MSYKTAFEYDISTKEYTKPITVQESPLEPNVYLMPVNATFVEPPNAQVGKGIMFDTGTNTWVFVDDFRGKIAYNVNSPKTQITIDNLGPVPYEFTLNVPPDYATIFRLDTQSWEINEILKLSKLKEAKIKDIDTKTSKLIQTNGFTFMGKKFSMSDKAQTNWIALNNGLLSAIEMLKENRITQAQYDAFFPVRVSTLDDEMFNLPNAEAVLGFYMTFMNYQTDPNEPLSSGRVLRNRVKEATTLEQLDGIKDTR